MAAERVGLMWSDFKPAGAGKDNSPERKEAAFSLVLPKEQLAGQADRQAETIIVLRSRLLGDMTIPPQLGEALLNTFIRTTAGSPSLPQALLLYGSAVLLAAEDSALLDVLQGMEKKGCAILCCRTSVAALLSGTGLAVGRLTDWLEFGEIMQKAQKILWP